MTSTRRRASLALLVTCLATLAVASLVWAMSAGWPGTTPLNGVDVRGRGTPAAADTARGATTSASPSATVGASRESSSEDPAVPTELVAPTVDLRMRVVATGVAADGQMALPVNPRRVGWYRFGPSPTADRGSTVLAGHVDSKRYGVGPLSRLRGITEGDVIRVATSDGRTIRFRTTSVRSIDKDELPLDAVFDRAGPPRLRIVTCGGEYDARNGGYQDHVVVTAVPVR